MLGSGVLGVRVLVSVLKTLIEDGGGFQGHKRGS